MTTKIFPRTISRLAAIQATFQHLIRPTVSIDRIIQDFIVYRFTPQGYAVFQEEAIPLDQDFFAFLVQGAHDRHLDIETIMASALPKGWSMEQMENSTRAIFRCAGFEIQACKSTPKGVILNEYITAAHCFLLDKGHGFVNAVLDHAFSNLRPESAIPQKEQTVQVPGILADAANNSDDDLVSSVPALDFGSAVAHHNAVEITTEAPIRHCEPAPDSAPPSAQKPPIPPISAHTSGNTEFISPTGLPSDFLSYDLDE